MKPPLNLSVNPWYYCNFSCVFCYLTPEQLDDRQLLPLEVLEQRVDEVMTQYRINHVDIYGGEVLLLPPEYLQAMKEIFHARGVDDIVLVTNLSVVNEAALDEDFELSVSYDGLAREKSELVFTNMLMLTRQFTILSLCGREFLDKVSVDDYVQTLNLLSHLKCVEIKPYSSNQANNQPVTNREFEEFVWAVLSHPERTFYMENETLIKQAVAGIRNSFSDDHVYITPSGEFAVLEFDQSEREFFLPVDGLAGYQAWCEAEKQRVTTNPFCASCEFLGTCLSEHLRDVKSMDNSCNGFKGLLLRWEEECSSVIDND